MDVELAGAPASGVFFHVSGNVTTYSSQVNSIGGFMAGYCLFGALDVLLIACIVSDERMRADGAYIYTASVGSAMLTAMILDMTQLVGFASPDYSWPNVDWLCEIGVTLQPGFENLPGLFLFFNMLEYYDRYKEGDPSTGPLSWKRMTSQIVGSVVGIMLISVIGVYGAGDGVIHYLYGDKHVCDALRSEAYVLTGVIWRSMILMALLVETILLARSKWEYSYLKDEPFLTSLDGVIGVLCSTLAWVGLTLPSLVCEGVAHLSAGEGQTTDYVFITRVIFLIGFGLIPFMWILIDPILAVNANKCCKTSENIEEVEVVVEHARF